MYGVLGNRDADKQILGERLEWIQALCSQTNLPLIRFVRGWRCAITNSPRRQYGECTYVSDEKRGREGNTGWSRNDIQIEARPKNWLAPVMLAVLRQCNSYGYEMMERAVEFGFEAVNPGTVYGP